jgi:hypothetical protein
MFNEAVTRLSDAINDVALLYAHEPDDFVVKAIKKMRAELKVEYGRLDLPDLLTLVDESLRCVLIQRHDIELGAGLPPAARTMH